MTRPVDPGYGKHIPTQVAKYLNNQIYYSPPPKGAQTNPKLKYQPFNRWDTQINQQPEWIQDLIKHVNYKRLTDVMTAVAESDHIIIVSDGSGKDFIMIFGWIMSTPDGTRFTRCAGHSYGQESYLRAEATSMLSASVFIAMMRQYNLNQDKEMRVQYVSDNMELVRREQDP